MNSTQQSILEQATGLLARDGYDAFSMRSLAGMVGISPSVMYHYYENKDDLLKAVYEHNNLQLGISRAKLSQPNTANDMLKQRIEFQLDHAEGITAVLKYYLAYRQHFDKNESGFIPQKAYLHIEEVLNYGTQTGEFTVDNITSDAKVMTHAINGFLLEYYPTIPQGDERKALVKTIHGFLLRALQTNKNVH